MMRIVRYFLSHIVLLIILAALVLAYFYRAHLFSDDVNAQVDNLVNKVITTVGISANKLSTETDTPETEAPEIEAKEEISVVVKEPVDEVAETKTEITEMTEGPIGSSETIESESNLAEPDIDVATSRETTDNQEIEVTNEQTSPGTQTGKVTEMQEVAGETEQVTEEAPAGSTDKGSIPVTAQATEAKQEPVEVKSEAKEIKQAASITEEVKSEDVKVGTQTPVAVDSDKEVTEKTNDELLNQARLAFQMEQTDKSISLYQELAELNPDDPNVHGEMGNVFYAQGKWKLAGAAYYEAASRLLKQGDTGQVQYLYRVIQGLDKDSAEKLRTQLGQ